jgi:hypothetical protein
LSRPDAAAIAALQGEFVEPKWFAYLDFANEPVRANTSGADVTFAGTGNSDLDGFTFDGISPDFVDISTVFAREGGSEQVVAKLSALFDLDNDMLNEIGDRANWAGRTAQLFRTVHDETGAQAGAIQHYYTGYMVDLSIKAAPGSQIIELVIESYLAAFTQPSNRDYNQARFDPTDKSYEAAIAIANGTSRSPLTASTPVGRSGNGGFNPNVNYS